MAVKSRRDVIRFVKDYNIPFIQIWFTDILGYLKGFSITSDELEGALSDGMGFDGSSVEGFARIDESDMIAMPDPTTFQILPWQDNDSPVARMYCDVLTPDGSHFEGDPRYILKRAIQKAADLGYKYYIGPELEFFILKDNIHPEPIDSAGYFDTRPVDLGAPIRKDMVVHLQKVGIQVEYSHHEVAPSQHEIDLRYDEGLVMADKTMTYRAVVKEVARQHGVHASFMPKPIFGENGNGMHTHQSLFRGSKNEFFDANDPFYLSKTARSYLAGLLRHAREFTAVTNQWINSYKRLVPGYEAPVYIAWARRNRSAMIRVPMYKPGNEQATRIELRSPDPACNPYLSYALMLTAGLKGIEDNYELPDPVERDIYHMTEEERKEHGIGSLPGNQFEAVQELEKSSLARETLGEHIFENFIQNKKMEWEEYCIHVSKFEIDKYYPVL